MTRWMTLALAICAVSAFGLSTIPTTQPTTIPADEYVTDVEDDDAVRFTFVDVTIDSGDTPLAAYQFELLADKHHVEIVGVEGGEHKAFKDAPHYDPAALNHNRIIIAAFDTSDDLPKGKTRVARVHLMITGMPSTPIDATLTVAGSTEGKPIEATINVVKGDTK